MNRRYENLGDFASRFGPEGGAAVQVFSDSLATVSTRRMGGYVRARIPRGTGALADSLQITMPTRDGFGRVTLSKPYAQAINIGRKKSKPYSRAKKGGGRSVIFSRRLGSKQRPRGMTRGAFRQLRREWPEVVAEAASHAEGAA